MFDALQHTSPTTPRRGLQRGAASNGGARGEHQLGAGRDESRLGSTALKYSVASETNTRLAEIMKSFKRAGVEKLKDEALARDMCHFLEVCSVATHHLRNRTLLTCICHGFVFETSFHIFEMSSPYYFSRLFVVYEAMANGYILVNCFVGPVCRAFRKLNAFESMGGTW